MDAFSAGSFRRDSAARLNGSGAKRFDSSRCRRLPWSDRRVPKLHARDEIGDPVRNEFDPVDGSRHNMIRFSTNVPIFPLGFREGTWYDLFFTSP